MVPWPPGNVSVDDFQNAIDVAIPAGEKVQVMTDGFTTRVDVKVVNGRVVRIPKVDSTMTVALTNTAVRLAKFKVVKELNDSQEFKRQALLAKGYSESDATRKAIGLFGKSRLKNVEIPEIVSMTSFQLSDITSISYRQVKPAQFVKARFGIHIVEIGILTIQCRGALTINSIYNNIADLYRHLDAAKSGAAIAATITTVEHSLQRLKELLDEGILTQDEFDEAKSGFVGKASDLPESAASSLRQLNDLFLAGILSEAEFRAKKFDVLSRI
jgi:hypothetical protein